MELEGSYFSPIFFWLIAMISLLSLGTAIWLAPWRRLRQKEQLHVFLGSCVALMVLWSIRTPVYDGIEFHLLILTTLTLMFGWALSVFAGALVLAGVTLAGISDFQGLMINLFTVVVLPVTFTQIALLVVRYWLPRHFFIYIYLNAFLAGGLAILLSSFSATLLMAMAGPATFEMMWDTYLTYFPLMFFPEAVLNGWFVTLLVSYKPQWVWSFRDSDYLQGK